MAHSSSIVMRYNDQADVPLQHNGASSRSGAVICVEVDFDVYINELMEFNIMEWITEGLKRAHECEDAYNRWHFVHGIRHDQWQDGELRLNGIQVTVAFSPLPPNKGYDWPLFPNEEMERPKIAAADILQCFGRGNTPCGVSRVGFSALRKPRILAEWYETVASRDSAFCRPGDGAGLHYMHTIPAVNEQHSCLLIQRECLQ